MHLSKEEAMRKVAYISLALALVAFAGPTADALAKTVSLSTTSGNGVASTAIPTMGLAAYWQFDEGSGSTAYDETCNNNDGTIRGVSWTNGVSGGALYFHGGGQWHDGDRVLVPHSSSLDITGELTITAWIKATGTDNYLAIVDKFRGGATIPSYGFTLYVSSGRLRLSIYSGPDGHHDGCVGTSELRDDTWHHVAGVWDGSHIKVYVDGQLEREVAWAFPPASTTNDLGIGERPYGYGGYLPFLGVIDGVCIYKKALSDTEIMGQTVGNTVDLTPYFDWGAISSYAGLAPPGYMGIWSPSHSMNFFFPSDSSAPDPAGNSPRAWLIPGVHLATFYGPDSVFIPGNPMVVVPDRYSKPCSLLVEIPPANLIDQATDSNVIQISTSETKTIPLNDTVETMVFLANCDGAAYCSPDQPLEVRINYQDGTADTVVFDNIHPGERSTYVSDPNIICYGNEVFGCGPFYTDFPPPYSTDSHSEFWHWYTLYPDNTKLLNSIAFVGIQSEHPSEIHISALSYTRPLPLEWGESIDNSVDLTPYFDWGAISSYAGLAPPGFIGIWSPSHSRYFYFPSDSLAPGMPPNYPRAWLVPGVHLATLYGPHNVLIPSNPIVAVPDRNFKPCSLFVAVPPANLIDEATDVNVIQISSGETKTIAINDTAETMVFLANCDGAGYCSPDQPLEVRINYNDGTVDTVTFANIHPGERANPIFWGPYTIYCNEVFGCGPFYNDLPVPYSTDYHSEFWHWYALYPDNTKPINSITFVGIQSGYPSEVHISALSYNKQKCDCIPGDADGNGIINIADVVYLISFIFLPGSPPPTPYATCSGDADCNCMVNISDVVYLINFIFVPGSAPPCTCQQWLAACGPPLR